MSAFETASNGPAAGGHDASAAEQAKEKAQHAAGEVRGRMREQVDQRSTQVGEQAKTVAKDVRSVGEHLRGEGKDGPARLADQVAHRVEGAGDWLKRSDADAILRDAERFGRERPWAVMAGGLLLGVAASRFLKASSSRRYHSAGSSANLPARRSDVTPAGIAGPAPTPATQPTRPVPGAPEREVSLSGGVVQSRPGTGSL